MEMVAGSTASCQNPSLADSTAPTMDNSKHVRQPRVPQPVSIHQDSTSLCLFTCHHHATDGDSCGGTRAETEREL